MKNYRNETIQQIVNTIKENEENIQSMQNLCAEMPMEEAAQKMLMDKYAITQMEAEEIVNDLTKGIADFDAQMEEACNNGEVNILDHLQKLTEGLSDEDRKAYYANILTALQLIKAGSITDDQDIEEMLKNNKALDEDTLVNAIKELSNHGLSLTALGSEIKDTINVEILNQVANRIKMNEPDNKLNVALWLYIAQRDGHLKLSELEVGVPAVTIGSLAAAGVASIIVTNDLMTGKINLEKWQVIMKWILGITIFITLLALAAFGLMYASALFLSLLFGILGTGWFATLVAFVLTIVLAYKASAIAFDMMDTIMDWLSDIYDKYIGPITEKIKSWYLVIKDSITHKVEGVLNEQETQSEEYIVNSSVNIANEPETLIPQPIKA